MSPWRLILIVCLLGTGCQTQKVEYRTRPAWHYSLNNSVDNEVTLDDGTVVRYAPIGGSNTPEVQKYFASIKMYEVDELTGVIRLRAVLPEHRLTQLLTCLKDRDWDLLHNQVLSEDAKYYFETRENGYSEFQSFFENNRRDLAKTLQRMIRGNSFSDVSTIEDGRFTIISLRQHVARDYKFKKITIVKEDEYLKLNSIE